IVCRARALHSASTKAIPSVTVTTDPDSIVLKLIGTAMPHQFPNSELCKQERETLRKQQVPEAISQDRRQLLGTAAMGVASAAAASLFPAYSAMATTNDTIRPFRVKVPQADLVDLRGRLLATRSPDRETVLNQSQGVQLATIQKLVRYWATDY